MLRAMQYKLQVWLRLPVAGVSSKHTRRNFCEPPPTTLCNSCVHQQSRLKDLAVCKLESQDIAGLRAAAFLLEGGMNCSNGDAVDQKDPG